MFLSLLLTPPAIDLLHQWDQARAHAFVTDDAPALSRLYDAGARAGVRDVRLLHRYDALGVRISSMRTQVFSVRPRPGPTGGVVLEVVDRVVATGDDGHRCLALPASHPREHRVTLRRVSGRWLVAAVR